MSNNNTSLLPEEEESIKDLLKFFERNGMLNTKESKVCFLTIFILFFFKESNKRDGITKKFGSIH